MEEFVLLAFFPFLFFSLFEQNRADVGIPFVIVLLFATLLGFCSRDILIFMS